MDDDGRDDDGIERVDDDVESDDSDEIPDFVTQENKRLNILVKEKKKAIKEVQKAFDQDFERHKILKEHLKNVEQEQLHTQGLIDAKNKETQSQNHMKQVTERQIGRLESEMKKLQKQALEFQERLNDTQQRSSIAREKCQQLKLQLNWNQEELELWAVAGKQKEQDNVTLQKFRKEDDAKIEQLNLQIQKLTVQVGRKQTDLDKEITETQTAQIELDKTAQEFKKQHDERHKLFEKWQQVTKSIAKRNEDINDMGQKIAAVKIDISKNEQVLKEKRDQLRSQAKLNKQQEAKNMLLMREISEKKNENKNVEFEEISNLQAKVEILKNQLSSGATTLSAKRTKVELLSQDLLAKKQRLHNEQIKYAAHQTKLRNQEKLAEKFEQAKDIAESKHKDNLKQKKRVEQEINTQKEALVKSTQELFKLKEAEVALYGQIQGSMAACRNLQSHINKLNQDFQRQQQLLYNAEYQIQLMERKVARAKGERTFQEKNDLQADIDKATAANEKVKDKHKILNEGVKKSDEDLRSIEARLSEKKTIEKKLTSMIEELTLENDMTSQDLNKISKKKEEVLVQHDIMKLEIKKIRETLTSTTNNVYSLENKKNQLEMSMQERQKEIQVHKDVLLAEKKAAEEERHKIAMELSERNNKVKNLKIKYEALVQKNHGSSRDGDTEHSQAYYVIKAAQEKEELQRKGDELSAKIIQGQKQLAGLGNALEVLKSLNNKTKVKYQNKGVTKDDINSKEAIKQQCDAASQAFFNKKRDLQRAQRQYEEDMRRYGEIRKKQQTLNERKKKLISQLNALSKEIQEGAQKEDRAKKSLTVQTAHFQRNNTQLNVASPHFTQLEYDIEVNKNKTVITCLMDLSQHVPEIGPILEDILKQKGIQLPQRAPTQMAVSSREPSVRSGVSGQSAISRASRGSSVRRK